MANGRVRLAIKLSAVTTLMVVATALTADYLARAWSQRDSTLWMLFFTLISLIIGLVATFGLDRIITVPIRKLMDYTTSMAGEDYQTPLHMETGDEIGDLAAALDHLRRGFLAQRSALQELNRTLDGRVMERTAQLQAALESLREAQEMLVRSEKLASVGRLAGGLAHEINNPACIILTRVGLLIDTAREQQLPAEFIEDLEVINRQVARITRITSDLLTFSRMSPMRQGPIDLSEVVGLTCSLFQYEARKRKVELQTHVAEQVMVVGDRDRLEQVCFNLIKNALDALEERGGGGIDVHLARDGRNARLSVEDNGPGIEAEMLGRIFDPFFTTKGPGKGTGLGLAITYGILAEHQGQIEAENRPEGGARFRVTLPLAQEGVRPASSGILWDEPPGEN